ncbi:MAG: poly-beta-1,6 N-acetyl-D-glucosamine synthase [Clostridium sp.]|nr:poly-beta-1,6 N-acetyl-D-glucosamine synthase [Clostridium sp.]
MNYLSGLTSVLRKGALFVFWYPYIMSIIWITGSLIFSHFRENREEVDFSKYKWPKISILLPCFNEALTVEETISNLSKLSYPDYEIIAVNDGSTDNTGKILEALGEKYEKLRVINCLENKGKANALHMAAHASKSEYLICVDSDAILDDKAPYYMVKQFIDNGDRVGAVTGNPRIRNRDTLLAKIQLVEYASIIGLIKRTQRILGKVMTVSGVIVAYRKKALVSVELWDRDVITEDIGVSWKLQKKFWDIRYEPRALCWMLVPETLKGLWNQRVRWAQGGQEIIFRHIDIFKDWRQRRIWPVYLEQVFSLIWSISWVGTTIVALFHARVRQDLLLFFSFSAFALSMLSFIQLFISMKQESTYDNIMKYYLWAAWYPTFYWFVNTFVAIAAIPKSIKSSIRGGYATWKSPDRGEIEMPLESEESEEPLDKNESERFIVSSHASSKVKILRKIGAYVLNIFMLGYMVIIFYLFGSGLFNHNDTLVGVLKESLKITNDSIRELLYITAIIFVLSFIVQYLWRLYNVKRFGKLNRRKHPGETTKEDMLSLNLVSEEVYDLLQREKIIRFEKNPIRELNEVYKNDKKNN